MSEQTKQCAYRVIGYDGSFHAYIGEGEKNKRVCRFCGKRIPDVKFRKKAHALSESIGNKFIINNEECDNCNEDFSVIEQDLYNRHAALLAFHKIGGKNGARKVKTETVDIFDQNGVVTLEPRDKGLSSINYDENGVGSFDLSLVMKYNPHRPQNVYKCLVKYALSIIETVDVSKFKNTISWIMNGLISETSLPKVLFYQTKFHSHPRCATFVRNENNNNFPFAFSIVEFANIGYCFMLPYANDEFITPEIERMFKGIFLQFTHGVPPVQIDLSRDEKTVRKEIYTIGNIIKKDAIMLTNPITPEIMQKLKEEDRI